MLRFSTVLFFFAFLTAAAGSPPASVDVGTDGQGGFVYTWAGEKIAFSLDSDNDGRIDITTYLWGDRTSLVEIEADDGRPEMMAVFAENGMASWYARKDESTFTPFVMSEGVVPSGVKDLLNASVVRRVRIDDGSLPVAPVDPAKAPPLTRPKAGLSVPITVVLFPAQEAPRTPAERKESPLPIRLPPIEAVKGIVNFINLPDLWLPLSAFNDANRVRAVAKMNIFLYQTAPPRPGADPLPQKRIQLCVHILVQSQRDDRFCIDSEFPEAASLFANAPSTDLTGRMQGSWFIEILEGGTGP